jgi:hypothetical protein
MVEFETLKAEEIPFGNNNFIEVARKRARDGERVNEFISLSRGFYTRTGEKRFRKSIPIPLEPNVIDFVAKKLREI